MKKKTFALFLTLSLLLCFQSLSATDIQGKITLRWNRAHLGSLDASQRWTDLSTLVYWELWIARELVQGVRLPWDRTSRKHLTPGQVRHQLGGLWARMGMPVRVPKPRGKSPGRRKGSVPRRVLGIRWSKRPRPRARHAPRAAQRR